MKMTSVTLTCSPGWCPAARCSWRGSAVVCWCSRTELTWVAGPIWACSHTIAACRNTVFDNIWQILWVIAKQLTEPSDEVRAEIPVLSRHLSSGLPPFHSEERHFKTAVLTVGPVQPLLLKWKLAPGLDSPERWGWWESSWCPPEWCLHSSPWAGRSCCSPSSNPWKAPLQGWRLTLLKENTHTQRQDTWKSHWDLFKGAFHLFYTLCSACLLQSSLNRTK